MLFEHIIAKLDKKNSSATITAATFGRQDQPLYTISDFELIKSG